MNRIKPEIALRAQAALGEGALWEDRTSVLYWIDIIEKKLHTFEPERGVNRSIQLGQFIGTVVTCESGRLLAALTDGAYFIGENGETTLLAALEPDKPTNRANDGKCDPAGRLVVGTMGMDHEGNAGAPRQGALYGIDRNGAVSVLDTGLSVPNGIAWAGDRMYHIDSGTRSLYAYPYDAATGTAHARELVLEVPPEHGTPDGMTIDSDGNLWVAMWGGWKVLQIDPVERRILSYIELPTAHITSCAFAGKNLDELYITSARVTLSAQELREQPHAGDLFVARPGASGLPAYRFGG